MKKNIICFTTLCLVFLIFKNYQIVLNSTIDGINIWAYKVFPFLFIMIIINDILVKANFANFFKSPALYVFIMSMFSGTPSSSYITSKLVKEKRITKEYADIVLLFTYFANPLFLYTILFSIFNNFYSVIKIMLIHYLSNIVIFIIYRKKLVKVTLSTNTCKINIAESIKSSINTNLMVLGSIIFYLIIANTLINVLPLGNNASLILRGILEMTQGLNGLIGSMPLLKKEILAVFFISFGGFSIHTQAKCILDEEGLDYKFFLKGRIIQTIIALFLTTIT